MATKKKTSVAPKKKAPKKSTALTVTEPSRKEYVKKIRAAMGRSVEGFVEAGRELQTAKAKLPHGQFEDMLKTDLAMSPQMARKLMAIAKHPVISNRSHGSDLPPAWTTLYELTMVPTARLEAMLKDHTIHPLMERAEVKELQPKSKTKKEKFKTEDDPEEETTSTTAGLHTGLRGDDLQPVKKVRDTVCPHCHGSGRVPVEGDF